MGIRACAREVKFERLFFHHGNAPGRGCQVRAGLSILVQDVEGAALPRNFEGDILAVFLQSFRACGVHAMHAVGTESAYPRTTPRAPYSSPYARSQIIQEAAAAVVGLHARRRSKCHEWFPARMIMCSSRHRPHAHARPRTLALQVAGF